MCVITKTLLDLSEEIWKFVIYNENDIATTVPYGDISFTCIGLLEAYQSLRIS